MAKITVAELDINTQAFLRAATDTKAVLDGLRAEQKKLRDDGKQSEEQFVKNEVAIKRLSAQYTEQKNVLVSLNSQNTDFIKTEKAINDAVNKENTTIQEARNNNKELLKVRNQLNLSTKAGQDALIRINGKLDENNKFIKENVSGYEKQKINIGNYEGALRSVFPQMNGVLNTLKQTKDALDLQKASMVASTTATNASSGALRLFKIALISTGIGAIVVALGSLITFLTSTQAGIDAVTKVTRPLQAIFQSMIGVVQNLGSSMASAFENPKEAISKLWEFIKTNLVNRIVGVGDQFKALGKIISSGFTDGYEDFANASLKIATGVDDVIGKTKEAAKETGKFFAEAAEKGSLIDKLTKQIEQGEAEIILKRKESAKQLKELQLIANDRSLGAAKNNEAAEKAIVIAKDLAKAEKDIISKKIQREEIEQSLNDSGREDLKKLNELKGEAIDADEKAAATQLKFLTAQSNLRKEQIAASKKANEEALKDRETFEKEKLALEEKFYLESEQDIFERERKKINIKYNADKLAIENLKISEDEKTELLKLKKQEQFNALTEIDKSQELAEEERIKQFNERKQNLLNELELANAETEKEKEELKVEQDLEKKMLELEQLELDEIEKTELLKLLREQAGLELDAIDEKYKLLAIKKEEDFEKRKTALRQKSFDSAVRLVGEETRLGKALLAIKEIFALKESIIELKKITFRGKAAVASAGTSIAEGQAQTAKVGFPQNIPLLIGFATQVGGIISAIKTATDVGKNAKFYEGGKVPYGTGGIITGQNIPTQTGGDNILATVKSGEVILNEQQQQRAGGAAFFSSIGVPGFATGGVVSSPTITTPITAANQNTEAMAQMIADRLNAVRYVAIEEEITSAQTTKVDIVSRANI